MKPIIIIPARMASTRLPNKPILPIAGKEMIIHVIERALEADIGPVYVACGDIEIKDVVEKYGYNAIMTNPELPSGTDRIFEAYKKIDEDFDIIVNVQGDLPTIEAKCIREILLPFKNDANVDITTLVAKITEECEINNSNVVKPVVSWNKTNPPSGQALYFTRASAPFSFDKNATYHHHIGMYAYSKNALENFVSLQPSQLELREKLEQLRALENNMNIHVIETETVPLGVDTKEDLEKAEKLLSK